MRLRKVRYAGKLIEDHPNRVFTDPKKHQGKWAEIFQNDQPIEIEVGCGKGQFIIRKAEADPRTNYIGIEKYDSVIIRGLEKLFDTPLENVLFIQKDAEEIESFFGKEEVSAMYLNFSDPWPKNRQAKRRLTHPGFLDKYKEILKVNAPIFLKTDNFGFYEYSMMQFNQDPDYEIREMSLDHHGKPGNVPTEFEEKFVEMGKQIFYMKIIYLGRTS